MLNPTLPTPVRMDEAKHVLAWSRIVRYRGNHSRVEYIPVPIMFDMFRQMIVTGPTS